MLKLITFLLTTLLFTSSASAFNPACEQIHFQGDEAIISGYSPSTDWVCYKLEIDEPITLSITLVADHALLTVLQNDDFQFEEEKAVAFLTRRGPLEVRVGPPYRSPSKSFTLIIKRNVEKSALNWQPIPGQRGLGHSTATSEDDLTEMYTYCSSPEKGMSFQLIHKGELLKKIDDASEDLWFIVENTGRKIHQEKISMYYFEPDLTHILKNTIGSRGLNAFGKGTKLNILNDENQLVATFDLLGSGKLRQRIRSQCKT